MKNKLLIIIGLLTSCTPLSQTSSSGENTVKTLRYTDFAYEPTIKTAVIRPASDDPATYLVPAATRIGHWDLRLEFDDLRPQQEYYYLRLLHCNRDWTPSGLQPLEFLEEYNEFPITEADFSIDTHIPYVHYSIALPPVKLPGNYLAVIYRDGNRDDIVLTKRFLVYDTQIGFEHEQRLVGAGQAASLNQQLNFTIKYDRIEVTNPIENLHVTIRQNHRWDNLATDIRPSFIREIEKTMEYRFFEPEKMFKGGNEFRFFDLRSLQSPGRNVASVDKRKRPMEVYIERDKTRAGQVYAQYDDYNGKFVIDNLDFGNALFSNYAWVNFTLASKPLPGSVFVAGELNYWNLDDENLMTYDSVKQEYQARLLLKQGWYDYQYIVKSASLPPWHLEGSHFETENEYEILVYYRPFRPNADLLVGYLKIRRNPR